jgi:hypothetical protein
MLNLWQSQRCGLHRALLVGTLGALMAGCGGASVPGAASLAPPTLALSAGKTLAAIGLKASGEHGSSAEGTPWKDRRVAFGLNNLLAESFYNTGKFRLVEEKDLRQRQLLLEVVDLFWSVSAPAPSALELRSLGRRLEADLLAYGKVGYSRSSSRRMQLGPVGSYQQKLRVVVEVCLYEVSTQETLCRDGEGVAEQDGVGALYEFGHDRADFEKSAAGRATTQAVTDAVQALLANIRFSL